MTRKDYVKLADCIVSMKISEKIRMHVATKIAEVPASDNCRFNETRFFEYIGTQKEQT